MSPADLAELNDRFAIADHVSFRAGPGETPVAEIDNRDASAAVALLGGHVLAFQPKGCEPVLWRSRCSRYEVGQPIRGGIPVCWPWFGVHPTDPQMPTHGFVRTAMWDVRATSVAPGEGTQIRLGITDSEATRALWPHAFELEIAVTVGPELRVELAVRNTGRDAFTCAGALHSYFRVSHAADIAIQGLDGCTYVDTVGPRQRKVQAGPVTIAAETDRIYVDTAGECTIDDPGLSRRIRIGKSGSRTTVVWNPWVEKSKRMEDFGDDEYPGMVCVETANAEDHVVTLRPDREHRLAAVIRV